jgi:hypothetical protein
MTNIELSLQQFQFVRKSGLLSIASKYVNGRQFPDTIDIRSHHTGRVVRFVKDTEAAIRNEFWDGEACQYKPLEPIPNVKSLMVFCDE